MIKCLKCNTLYSESAAVCLYCKIPLEKPLNFDEKDFYDKNTIVKVFDQNHFNLVIIELFIFAFILVLGIFKDTPVIITKTVRKIMKLAAAGN